MSDSGWYRHLLRYVPPHRAGLALGGLITVTQALVLVALPWPTKLAVDYVLAGRDLPGWARWVERLPGTGTALDLLLLLAAATVVLAVANGATTVGRRVWRRDLGATLANELARDTLDRVQRRSPLATGNLRSGDLVQRIVRDTKCVDTLVFGVGLTVFQSLVTFVLLGTVMVNLSGLLAVVALAFAAPMLLAVRSYRGRMERDALRLADAEATVMTGSEQMLYTLQEVQSFGAEDAELRRFTADTDAQVEATMRAQRTALGFQVSIGSITAIGTGAVMVIGGLAAVDGDATVGEVLVFISYLASIYGPIEGLAYLSQSVATSKAGAQRVLQLVSDLEEVPEREDCVPLPATRRGAQVEFDHVTFGYRPGEPVLSEVDLTIAPGEVVAIVGGSGAGKSTLVSLVPRFFDPWSGSIRIDGVDVREASIGEVRRRVALVRQDPLLLPATVSENIAYGSERIDPERVRRCAHDALASGFVEELDGGYDAVLGERGATLSGGQRQRLAIARALYRDAPILILDEPTASLDAAAETALLELVQRAAAGRTIVMIAHRLSTVRQADRIIVLVDGRVVEQGGHEELEALGGVYAGYLAGGSVAGAGDLGTVPTSERAG